MTFKRWITSIAAAMIAFAGLAWFSIELELPDAVATFFAILILVAFILGICGVLYLFEYNDNEQE